MTDAENNRSLVPLPDATLALARPEAGSVLSKMVRETLDVARGMPLFKLGEYEWCEPDFRQILLWAEQLALEPEEVIRRLLDERSAKPIPSDLRAMSREAGNDPDDTEGIMFKIWPTTLFRDGRIVKLNWDCDLLPLSDFRLAGDLKIKCLRIVPGEYPKFVSTVQLSLRTLTTLCLENLGIRELDLSDVSYLEFLCCSKNELATLDLSGVPKLEYLDCRINQLSELDIRPLLNLERLEYGNDDFDCGGMRDYPASVRLIQHPDQHFP